MTADDLIPQLPGGHSLIDWFGQVPTFHDGVILELNLAMERPGSMRVHTWAMTNQADANRRLILEKHCIVEIGFATIKHVNLAYFHRKGIIFDLQIHGTLDRTTVAWDGSYGTEGSIIGTGVQLSLTQGRPQ